LFFAWVTVDNLPNQMAKSTHSPRRARQGGQFVKLLHYFLYLTNNLAI